MKTIRMSRFTRQPFELKNTKVTENIPSQTGLVNELSDYQQVNYYDQLLRKH